MNTVPINFCERVMVTRKCCGELHDCCCPSVFVNRKWKAVTQIEFFFYIGVVDKRWKYGFHNLQNNDVLTLDELRTFPDIRYVSVCWIGVVEPASYEHMLIADVVDLQKLLNFVTVLSNEPWLNFEEPPLIELREGRTILKWLEGTLFSTLSISTLTPDYHRLVENQFARREPTYFSIVTSAESAEFLQRRLMSGAMRRCSIDSFIRFPTTVIAQIIKNVLDLPEDYRKHEFSIEAHFDDAATQLIEEMGGIPNDGTTGIHGGTTPAAGGK